MQTKTEPGVSMLAKNFLPASLSFILTLASPLLGSQVQSCAHLSSSSYVSSSTSSADACSSSSCSSEALRTTFLAPAQDDPLPGMVTQALSTEGKSLFALLQAESKASFAEKMAFLKEPKHLYI
jgi:hypothetical protein